MKETDAKKETSENKLLSQNEVAEMLGVLPCTLQSWRVTHRYPLKYIKCGRLVRYRLSDVEEFLQARTVGR